MPVDPIALACTALFVAGLALEHALVRRAGRLYFRSGLLLYTAPHLPEAVRELDPELEPAVASARARRVLAPLHEGLRAAGTLSPDRDPHVRWHVHALEPGAFALAPRTANPLALRARLTLDDGGSVTLVAFAPWSIVLAFGPVWLAATGSGWLAGGLVLLFVASVVVFLRRLDALATTLEKIVG